MSTTIEQHHSRLTQPAVAIFLRELQDQGYRNSIILLIVDIKMNFMYFFIGLVKQLVKGIEEPKGPK